MRRVVTIFLLYMLTYSLATNRQVLNGSYIFSLTEFEDNDYIEYQFNKGTKKFKYYKSHTGGVHGSEKSEQAYGTYLQTDSTLTLNYLEDSAGYCFGANVLYLSSAKEPSNMVVSCYPWKDYNDYSSNYKSTTEVYTIKIKNAQRKTVAQKTINFTATDSLVVTRKNLPLTIELSTKNGATQKFIVIKNRCRKVKVDLKYYQCSMPCIAYQSWRCSFIAPSTQTLPFTMHDSAIVINGIKLLHSTNSNFKRK